MTSFSVTSTIVPHCNTVTSSLDSSGWYISTTLYSPLFANAALPSHPCLQIFYLPSAHCVFSSLLPYHHLLLVAFLLRLLFLLPPHSSGFFNGMQVVSELGSLNCFTFFCSILLTLSVSRNPIFTNVLLSGSLDSLLCVLIAPTPGLAFSLLMTGTLAAASPCSSGRAYLSLNFLPPLSPCMTPTLIM